MQMLSSFLSSHLEPRRLKWSYLKVYAHTKWFDSVVWRFIVSVMMYLISLPDEFKWKNLKKHTNYFFRMSVESWCSACFCAVLCVCFCTGYFVIVTLNLTCLHCLQHSYSEHHFNLYYLFICFNNKMISWP